jgi:hypothetical protein
LILILTLIEEIEKVFWLDNKGYKQCLYRNVSNKMKQTLSILAIIFSLNWTFAQDQSQLKCLPRIDSIVGEFYSDFSDTNVCVVDIKRSLLKKMNQYMLSHNKTVFDSTDLTTIGIYRPRFEN